jgi:hypothetical protein
MADKSFTRTVSTGTIPKGLRLPPFPKLPERIVRAFPELRAYEAEVEQWAAKMNEAVRVATDPDSAGG